MRQGYITACACTPVILQADPSANADHIIEMLEVAEKHDATVLVFPELALTGGSCGDLLRQHSMYQAVEDGIIRIVEKTADMDIVTVFGAPVKVGGRLYNCAVVASHGKIFGIVPKLNGCGNNFTPALKFIIKPRSNKVSAAVFIMLFFCLFCFIYRSEKRKLIVIRQIARHVPNHYSAESGVNGECSLIRNHLNGIYVLRSRHRAARMIEIVKIN